MAVVRAAAPVRRRRAPVISHGAQTPAAIVVTPTTGTVYGLHVSDAASSFDTTLTNATPGEWVDELNGPGSFSFTMGLYDSQAALCDPSLGREFRLYRAGTLVAAGPILADDVDAVAHKITFRCANLLAYFAGRNIDRGAGRINLLTNPDFETDAPGTRPPTGWTESGITSSVDQTQHVLGTRSCKLVQTNPSTDTFVKQAVVKTAGGIGDLVTVAAWFYIDNSGTWTGPPLEGWGLVVKQTDGGSTVYDFANSTLDSDTPRGAWQRAEATTWIPPNATRTIEVHLQAPGGVIWWDAVSVTLMESLSALRSDQAQIAESIVRFLQNTTYSKSDLHIATFCPATGMVRDRAYQFADHTAGDVALREFPAMDGGFDYGIGADRVFRTYYPRRGVDRSPTVTLTGDSNCVVKRRTFDAAQAASQVIALAPGDGPDREEGGASDDTALGAVTWQRVLPANSNRPLDTLQPTAIRELAVAKNPVHYEAQITNSTLVGLLELGDSVSSSFSHGYISETRKLRIITKTLDPQTDTLTVGLNVA